MRHLIHPDLFDDLERAYQDIPLHTLPRAENVWTLMLIKRSVVDIRHKIEDIADRFSIERDNYEFHIARREEVKNTADFLVEECAKAIKAVGGEPHPEPKYLPALRKLHFG